MRRSTDSTDQSDGYEWFLSRCFHDEYKIIPIRQQCLTLGRGDAVDYQFCPKKYYYLSRKHCMLQIINGKPTITDCNSERGTFVNGERLDKFCPGRVDLKEGDLVGIGHKNDEIQQYFKFHTAILKYRLCRKIRDDEAIIISDEEIDVSENPLLTSLTTDTPSAESLASTTTASSEYNESKSSASKLMSPVPGPSGLRLSGCVSVPRDLLKNSSFEEEYDMCATRLNEVCYESDTEPSCAIVSDEIITLSDDDDDEFTDLHHTQAILEEVKKELADIAESTTTDNVCEATSVQWTLKLNSNKDVDATQRYKQKTNGCNGKNDSNRKGSASGSAKKKKDEDKGKKSSKQKDNQKSAEHNTGKERKKSSNEAKGEPIHDVPLKISLKRNSTDWVISNDLHNDTKKSCKSVDAFDKTDGSAADDDKRRTVDGIANAPSKTVVQEQPKNIRKRRHSVAGWTELGARKPNGTIEITPPEQHQWTKAGLTHRPPLWMTSFNADPKPPTADPKTATADPKPATVEPATHSATGESGQKTNKLTLKRRRSIASPEEMHVFLQKKFKSHANGAGKIFDFHPITAASKEQKEQRKNRLIEVTMNKKNQEKTAAAKDDQPVACKKTVATKPKVKFTPNNRGMFLTAPIPPPPSRAASTSRPTSTDESIMCTQSTTLDQVPFADVAAAACDTRPKKLTFESMARLSNVDRPLPSGSELRRITARRFSVMEPPTYLKGPSGSSSTTNHSVTISSHGSTVTSNITATSSSNSTVTHSSARVILPGGLPLKSILKAYNTTNGDASVKRKKVTIEENLNKTNMVEKYIIAEPKAVRDNMLAHEQELLVHILRWSPQWLMEKQSECARNTPYGGEDNMLPKLKDYENYESFRRIHTPFLMRELWNEVSANYKLTQFPLIACTVAIRPTKRSDLCEIECEVPIKGLEQQRTAGYDFGIMEFQISQQRFVSFFYIHTQKPTKLIENGHDKSGPHSTHGMKFVLYASGQEIHLLRMGCNFKLHPFTRIYLFLRRANALCALKFSQLLCSILTPSFNVANILEIAKRPKPSELANASAHVEPGTLNPCQMKVLSSVLAECFTKEVPTISIIQGPPGTGKSRVITQLILKLIRIARSTGSTMKVLVCAASNTAVDVIVKKLLIVKSRSAQTNNLKLVRTGSKNKVEPSCTPVFIDNLIRNKLSLDNGHAPPRTTHSAEFVRPMRTKEEITARNEILNEAEVVCTTLGSCSMLASYSIDITFDVCIIDEATQCTELCTLLPLQYGISKLVLVGDVHQLPATVLDQQSVESGFRKSLFSRIHQSYIDNKQEEKLKVLTTQYRMHPEISYWPNKHFYRRQLKNAPCTEVHRKEMQLKPYMVISLSYDQELTQAQFEIYNKNEIQLVVGLLKQMVKCFDKHASFAIITPYARHKEELAKTLRTDKLERVAVHSIDSVQGKEFDVVIISLARSNGAGFLDQPERINVALTRAKQCLVLCGNFTSLKRKPVWSSLLADAQKRKVYYELDDHDPHSHGAQMVENIMQRLRKN
uniref:FHA domain-containing protein n=1 Tax=Anopheles minimus TaxID=112268 RepID=A0A182WJZ5_9DIPT